MTTKANGTMRLVVAVLTIIGTLGALTIALWTNLDRKVESIRVNHLPHIEDKLDRVCETVAGHEARIDHLEDQHGE